MKTIVTKNHHTLFLARVFLIIGLLTYAANAYANIRYVKATSAGAADGSSWDNASNNLQAMITASAIGDEVWVAKGNYLPASNQSFRMANGVKIYGGFVGNNETSIDQRDLTITANASILKGNGSYVIDNPQNNLTATAVLDGFTITGSSSSGIRNFKVSPTIKNCTFTSNTVTGNGGGINNEESSPIITNCSFTGNTTSLSGGAISNVNSSPTLTNCSFADNTATLGGGGAISNSNSSSPTITNCSFTNNTATNGGAIINTGGSPSFTNCSFANNTASSMGGGIYNSNYSSSKLTDCSFTNNEAVNGGGMYDVGSSPLLTNCTFTDNTATGNGGGFNSASSSPTLVDCFFTNNEAVDGGGMYNTGNSPKLTNCSFTGNSATTNGGGIHNSSSSPLLTDCIITENTASNYGGGMYNTAGANAKLTNCSFTKNASTENGGGMYNNFSSPTLTNCSFTSNTTPALGGGMYTIGNPSSILINCSFSKNEASTGGGIYNFNSSQTLTNCSINANKATTGSGIYNFLSSPTLTNCSISSNNVHGIFNKTSSSPKLRNSIVYGNASGITNEENSTPEIKYSLVQGLTSTDANGNISGDTDPLFVNPSNGDFRLQLCSPVINKGSNSVYDSGQTPDLTAVTTDLTGKPRFNNNGIVDMGAYELEYNASIIYVKEGGTGPGTSWGCATGDLQAAIDAAQSGDEVWVTGGNYSGIFTKGGVKIYGGFQGNETNLSQRDLTNTTNSSILTSSGTVVIAHHNRGLTNATLDGFTVTGGGNGGISCTNTALTVRNCSIKSNTGHQFGGVYAIASLSSLVLINCSILNNSSYATGGGGVTNDTRGSTTLINCTISGNSGPDAGGIYNFGSESLKLRNCIVSGNSSGINFATGSPDIQYSLVQGINSTSNNNISGDTDPLFVDPANGDFRLQLCSPVINKGSNSVYDSGQTPDLTAVTTDLAENPRFFQNGTVDMGAYEYSRLPLTTSTIHVDSSIATPGNGDSWTTAIRSLAEAIQIAHQSCVSIDKILVAKGTYYPEYRSGDGTTNRHKAFTITRKGLEILGGYPTGGSGDRDPNAHPTILSGDLGVVNDNSDNAYHVLLTVGSAIDETLKLDGFTIRDGNANGPSGERITVGDFDQIHSVRSGGWYNVYGNPVLNNIKIINNLATSFGAGVLNEGGSPTVTNVTISNNSAQNGGAWYNNVGNPILKNVVIRGNSVSSRGGGWFNNGGSPAIQNVLITGNTATLSSAAWHNSSGTPSLLNCTITGNNGGGASIQSNNDIMSINNGIVWGPSETDFLENLSEISYVNSIVRGSGGSTNWNNLAGHNGTGNLDKDPLFVDPANGNYQLQLCSPAINTGNTALITDQSIPDLNGNTRVVGTKVDMGAYEYQAATVPFAGVLYVKEGGVGTGNSWECATGDLQAAITAAAPGGKEVWVAKGSYLAPSNGSFVMQEGVKIYGGFAGNETSLNERDLTITANASTLRGNGSSVIRNDENHLTTAAVLDGFTVTGGSSSGIYNLVASPTIKNCIITDNTGNNGGGLYIHDSAPQLINCTISNNTANWSGGGIYSQSSESILTNCIITGNRAMDSYSLSGGGGICNTYDSSPTLTNCTISNNSSNADGGGMFNRAECSPTLINCTINNNEAIGNGGGIFNHNKSSPTLKNCSISGNRSNLGGGMYSLSETSPILTNCSITGNKGGGMYNMSSSSPTLTNCTISANTEGNSIYNETESSPKLRNSIVYGNSTGISNNNNSSPDIKYSLVQGLTSTSDGNISGDTDPLFVDPANGDFHLQLCSPVINKGSNEYYATGKTPDLSGITTDLDGEVRFYGNGTADMGAYEFHQFSTTPVPGVTYVKAGETGTGTSWDCAMGDLQAAINSAESGEEVWVAGGNYKRSVNHQYFSMNEGVKIYGGFKGDETSLTQRDLTNTNNTSTLLGHNLMVMLNANNSLSSAAVLDGFTITGGVASGVHNISVSPTFRNCIITSNWSTNGGGMTNEGASPVLINCIISNNISAGFGGGLFNESGASPFLINCTISDNKTYNNETGGGISNLYSSPTLLNSIVYGNNSGIYNLGSSPDIRNSLVQGLTSTDNGNISGDTDPLFVFPEIGDYRLQPCSPVINKGSDSFYESGQTPDLSAITTDLLGEPRFYGTVDMGAYEYAGSPSVPTLAGNNAEFTQTIFGNTVIGVGGSACTIIASLLPNRGAPLSGDVTAKVWVESTQPKNFVKRHYQITAAGAESATAKVTLYFTQQEFDEFNLENTVKLPVDAEDTDNYKTNLRIEKQPGNSDDDSGLPGSYSGTPITINPLDPAVNGSITWNAFASRWEVCFDVTGFSGFFVKTTEAALPLNLISFTATKENAVNLLNWKTTNEINTQNFEVQSSSDAKNFTQLTTVPANGSGNHTYSYQDATPYFANVYYRLKMVDRDGSFAYSKIISLMNDAVGKATIHPNPAVESITLTISPSLLQSTTTLYDVTGRQLQRILLTTNKQQVDVKSLSSGVYILKFADGTAERFVKE